MLFSRLGWRRLGPLVVVTAAAAVFTTLLIFVRLRWAPLESADRTSAADVNNLVASHAALVSALKILTMLGSAAVLCVVVGLAVILLAIRRLWRLALYLLAAGAGALVLDPLLKSLVGRLRRALAHPIAHGTGSSFPSGHALGSMVCYGALLLVFLPAVRGRWRTVFVVVVATIILIVGISRILLGVHYVSDVIGGWAIGVIWLGITALAFELTRAAVGERVTAPVTEGLEPEDRRDLILAEPERARSGAASGGRSYGRIAAAIVDQLGAHPRRRRRSWRADHEVRERQRARRPVDSALVRYAPHAGRDSLEPDLHHPWGFGGDRDRLRCGERRVPRDHAPVAASYLHRDADGRRDHGVPGGRGDCQAAPASCPASRSPLAYLGVPVWPHRGDLLHLRRHRHLGHRAVQKLVAVAVPDPSDCHAGAGRALAHVPRGAPPNGRPRRHAVRSALANRRHIADQARRSARSIGIRSIAGKVAG